MYLTFIKDRLLNFSLILSQSTFLNVSSKESPSTSSRLRPSGFGGQAGQTMQAQNFRNRYFGDFLIERE